jgi:aminopeptidase
MTTDGYAVSMGAICRDHMALSEQEKLLVVADSSMAELAAAMVDGAVAAEFDCSLAVVDEVVRAGQAPPEFNERLLTMVPAVLLVTSRSLSHTEARRRACYVHGTRIASLPGLTKDMLTRLFAPGSADMVVSSTVALALKVDGACSVRLEGPAGTELSLSVQGRKLYLDTGLYHATGNFGNLPAGEVAWSPVPGSANGRIVADVAFAGLGAVNGLELHIENGRLTEARGPRADELHELLSGEPERVLGEFGIGCNALACPGAITLEAEKAAGTVHFGFGDSRSFGGDNAASGHWDCVVRCARLQIDNRVVELTL